MSKKEEVWSLLKEYHDWVIERFPESTAMSSLIGLEREIQEVKIELVKIEEGKNKIFDLMRLEYADCLMYLLDSATRANIDTELLFLSLAEKLKINKERNWSKNEDNSYSHIK